MVQAVCAILAVVKECGIAPRRMPQNLAGMERRASPELGKVEHKSGDRVGVPGRCGLALPNTHCRSASIV